jgi:hypothetical protein
LRSILWWFGQVPWNYANFLDYAADRIFLQKVGGGYIFVHRLLQKHFAALPLASSRTAFLSPRQRRQRWLVVGSILSIPLIMCGAIAGYKHWSEKAKLNFAQSIKPTLENWQQQAEPIIVDKVGRLEHHENKNIKLWEPVCCLGNFIAEVRFFNPYERWWTGTWDYGLRFRVSNEAQYRLSVRANQTWELNWVKQVEQKSDFQLVASGKLTHLDVSENGLNVLRLVLEFRLRKNCPTLFWVPKENKLTKNLV